jgi:Protein of unknown function (DUF1257)
MSAYKTIKCSFKDKKTLLESLKSLGYKPVEYEEKHNLRGYQNDTREEKAEIIVPKEQILRASNDLGFSYDEKEKEFIMLCSDFDNHQGVSDKVRQSYAVTAIKNALKKNKFSINTEEKNKTITISASKII